MTAKPLATLASLAVCAALLVGCSDDAEPEAGPTDSPSQTDSPTSGSSSSEAPTSPDPSSSGPDEPLETDGDGDENEDDEDGDQSVPADAAQLCDVFTTAFDALVGGGAELPTDETSRLSPELLDALREWGQGIEDAELPSDLTDDEREGLQIMSRLLLAVPDDATGADLDALDAELSGGDDELVDAAGEWAAETCDLGL